VLKAWRYFAAFYAFTGRTAEGEIHWFTELPTELVGKVKVASVGVSGAMVALF